MGIECQWTLKRNDDVMESLFALTNVGFPITSWRCIESGGGDGRPAVPALLFTTGSSHSSIWTPLMTPIDAATASTLALGWLRNGVDWGLIDEPDGDGSSDQGYIFRAGAKIERAYGYSTMASVAIEPVYNYYGK